ncbi:MAG TPA: tetratricopeptide repeat protein [Stellaceae bacterium]|nr:tetratricopeptide repeat protein [Stellaceae bacterium]
MASRSKNRISEPARDVPPDVAPLFHQGLTLHQQGRTAEAARLYRTVLQKSPNHFDAQNLLGLIEYQMGNFSAAVRLIGRALRLDPSHAPAHSNLGNALHRLKRLDEALASYDKALAIRPDYAIALFNRGNVLLDLKRHAEALTAYDQALALAPGDPEMLYNRGQALMELGRFGEALEAYDTTLAVRPDDPQTLCNRGNALYRLHRPGDALASYAAALRLRPDDAGTHYNIGQALRELGRLDEALVAADRASALRPDYGDALYSRGETLEDLRRYDEAAASFERLLKLAPAHDYAMGELLFCRLASCDWTDFAQQVERVVKAVAAGKRAAMPFSFLAMSGSPEAQRQCAASYAQDKIMPIPALWRGERYRHDKLRVAYLSVDFREHPVAQAMVGMFERHDRSRFETTALSIGPNTGDLLRLRLEKAFDRFIDAERMADQNVAVLLRELEADIAVDLQGFTYGSRPGIFAARPAPVLVNHIGYPGTIGSPILDYLIADHTVVPDEQRPFYSEKICRLPDCYWPNDTTRHIADETPSRAATGLPETGFVFCAFNNNHKITPDIFAVWMRLLREVEGSVLWLLAGNPTAVTNLRREAAARGIDPERLIFAPRAEPADHLARHRLADLFLDNLPFNGHSTTADALWTGLPVVTCLGAAFAARVAGSMLRAVGLPELVTDNLADYEALTLRLAQDPKRLAAIKAKLAANRLTYPLFDTARFTRHIESAYETMRERTLRGEPPEDFAVEKLPR